MASYAFHGEAFLAFPYPAEAYLRVVAFLRVGAYLRVVAYHRVVAFLRVEAYRRVGAYLRVGAFPWEAFQMEASLAFADFGWVGVEVHLSVAAGWGILEVWRTSMVAGEVGEYEVDLEVDLCQTDLVFQVHGVALA